MRRLIYFLLLSLLISCGDDPLQDNFKSKVYKVSIEREVFAEGYIKSVSGDSVYAYALNVKKTYGQFYADPNYQYQNLLDSDASTLYSLGGLGGSVTFEFDSIQNKDLIVYGNSDCEPAFVQTSLDGRHWKSVFNPDEYGIKFVTAEFIIPQPQLTWDQDKNFEFCKVVVDGDTLNHSHKRTPARKSISYCPDSVEYIKLDSIPYLDNQYFKSNKDLFVDFPDGSYDSKATASEYRCEIALDQPFKYIKFTSMLDSISPVTGEISPEIGLILLKDKE